MCACFVGIRSDISIHAPSRGATAYQSPPREWDSISIHAPSRGATAAPARALTACAISIHAPSRGATFGGEREIRTLLISIHAPSRGATSIPLSSTNFKRISIHAPSRGATLNDCRAWPGGKFQSTLPRGERRWCSPTISKRKPFQSTLPRGERPGDLLEVSLGFSISIHAPSRGATAKFAKAGTQSKRIFSNL